MNRKGTETRRIKADKFVLNWKLSQEKAKDFIFQFLIFLALKISDQNSQIAISGLADEPPCLHNLLHQRRGTLFFSKGLVLKKLTRFSPVSFNTQE